MTRGGRRERKTPQTEAWARYWADPKAPHPDAQSKQSGTGGPPKGERVLAPFNYSGDPSVVSSHDKRESFYCHHYRQPNEHYHKTLSELEGCEQ